MQFVSTSVASSNQTNAANTGPQQELLRPSLSAFFPVEHRAWEAKEIATARVWVRFLRLPIEYYDEEALEIIAYRFGKPIKIDVTIDEETHARSARICVEIDLRKPRCCGFRLEGYKYKVEYESTHSFCFNCGQVGHLKKTCKSHSTVPNP
ncbi:hypothetical protein RHMOL_Rhmol10G0105700 [Rhododendron molle]|uniref:Uncharacterized protein n=1 Tax=Rhododendron molle TaxID=49168 RepID=A0ACC0M264_RHOML|nr:hypothetical protein RHMOL_Rhmol10G0105700 [Rhododendron molle]